MTENPSIREIGVLGSTTIVKTALYETRFSEHGVKVVYPEVEIQDKLFEVIRTVKSGKTSGPVAEKFVGICNHLKGKGVSICILGCTELGVIRTNLPIKSFDTAEILAREIVAIVKNRKVPFTT